MFQEDSLTKEQRLQMFNIYQGWFDNHGYTVHWSRVEFVLKHWKVDATKETPKGKVTNTFYMTPDKMTRYVGFGKAHKEVSRIVTDHKEDVFERMRSAVNG